MRLLRLELSGDLRPVEFVGSDIPQYAILSHTWGPDHKEITLKDLVDGIRRSKAGYRKLIFCAKQAKQEGIQFCWIDTCCIDKSSSAELSEAINSMYRWYHAAKKCYVYLSDVSYSSSVDDEPFSEQIWVKAFRTSRWFSRGRTLQELLAPQYVDFFSFEGYLLGSKASLQQHIHDITNIPIAALQSTLFSNFDVSQKMSWAQGRKTKREEDGAYSLLGLFDIHMPLIYGEGRVKAFTRLWREVKESAKERSQRRGSKDFSEASSHISHMPMTTSSDNTLGHLDKTGMHNSNIVYVPDLERRYEITGSNAYYDRRKYH
jgi:hypothetical protein